jgi:BirA family biotin operon repressor/biotin-[acetyl-CoA-carboxylase] ligase
MAIGENIIYREIVSSTNIVAAGMMAVEEITEGTVLHTDFQTQGLGQKGNKWESERGMNLCMSVILYPTYLYPDQQFQVSKVISLALYDFVSKYSDNVFIKWANDIFVNNDKIAGILIEHSIAGKNIQSTIAGIGINLNQKEFKSDAPNPVSLKQITGIDINRDIALEEICSNLDGWYNILKGGNEDLLNDTYQNHLYRLGEWCDYLHNNQVIIACLRGVDSYGQLLLEDKKGEISSFTFNEIDFIM